MDREDRAPAQFALHVEGAAVVADDVLDDGESEPRAAEIARARRVDPVEALGQARQLLARDPLAAVAHGDRDGGVALAAAPARQQEAVAATRLEKAGRAWDGALAVIDETRKKQAQAPGLAEPAKKALATLDREWDGLAAHRGYPLVSLDNNVAERVTWRLNSGVPPAEVAAWAGHSVEVLMRTYARCVTGMEDVWIARMDKTLHPEEDQ